MTFLQLNIIDFILRNQFTPRGVDGRVYGHVITKILVIGIRIFAPLFYLCS